MRYWRTPRPTRCVRASDLDWTVIRAPRLGESEGYGEYQHSTDLIPGMGVVARADVALFLLDVLEEDLYLHELPKTTY